MGSQRRMAMALMEKYLLDEDTAWDRTTLLEAISLGDDLSEAVAVFAVTPEVSPQEALATIKDIRDRISSAIEAAEKEPWPLRRSR